jgi:translation initiation factor IF-3
VGENGEQLGVRPLPEALQIARERDLDLVEVAANSNPPVCRIMDFNRFKYEQEQKRKESRRKTTNILIKEMKFRPKIDGHDFETKMKHVRRFLGEGNKVKVTIMFRGREMAHTEFGLRILEKIADDVQDDAIVESSPKQDGRNMIMVLTPTKKPEKKKSKHPEPQTADATSTEPNPTAAAPTSEAPTETTPPEAPVEVAAGAVIEVATEVATEEAGAS